MVELVVVATCLLIGMVMFYGLGGVLLWLCIDSTIKEFRYGDKVSAWFHLVIGLLLVILILGSIVCIGVVIWLG